MSFLESIFPSVTFTSSRVLLGHSRVEGRLDIENNVKGRRGIARLDVLINLKSIQIGIFVERVVKVDYHIRDAFGVRARVITDHLRFSFAQIARELIKESCVHLRIY